MAGRIQVRAHPAAAALAAAALVACTTVVQPVTCTRGSTECGGISDARFCENVAVAVNGADCAVLGIVEARPFCVVTAGRRCIHTSYAIRDRDCRVVRYETLRDDFRAGCPEGAPTFVNRSMRAASWEP